MIMTHGVEVMSRGMIGGIKMVSVKGQQRLNGARKTVGVMGSRRIFPPAFKLKVLDSYRNDAECRGNQRATARKYGIHRRQIQKWLQCEENLRKGCQQGAEKHQAKAADVPALMKGPPSTGPSRALYGQMGFCTLSGMYALDRGCWNAGYEVVNCAGSGCNGYAHLGAVGRPYSDGQNEAPSSPEGALANDREASDSEMVPCIKIEKPDEEDEERNSLALKRERECTDSETERRSPVGSSALTPLQDLASPQGPGSTSYRSSSESDADGDYSSSSSLSQHPADLARRRSFSLRFKLDVLDAFHRDSDVANNQRATANKFNINRRQVQKWLSQETMLRDEICLRGGMSRQRLASAQDGASFHSPESPVDLRTRGHQDQDAEPRGGYEMSASPRLAAYCHTQEGSFGTCNFNCCTFRGSACYSDLLVKSKPCYDENPPMYCHSPHEIATTEVPFKDGCYYTPVSPPMKCESGPPQDAPLCLVKSKIAPTVAPSAKRDAILFKPYLDNPVSRPGDDLGYNNNSNTACNLNEQNRPTWINQNSPPVYMDLPQRSAFVRYPTCTQFT